MTTAKTVEILRQRLSELTEAIVERQTELDQLVRERDALLLAVQSIEKIQDDILDRAIGDEVDEGLTYRQKVVFDKIPIGRSNALPPVMIGKRCPSIEPDYVRKTLKRLSDYGRINTYDSKYWRDS
jgi:hypothetical protein